MASNTADNDKKQFSCRCLNIRINPTAMTDTVVHNSKTDSEFTQVHVGEDGISVVHPQVTVRIRTRGIPIPGTSRCSRFTNITCLICELLVYRVNQTVPVDIEGKEGPLLPTEEWVEREILKSSSGWIEVHKQCLTNGSFQQAESSPDYSPIFSLVLPPPSSTATSPEPPSDGSPLQSAPSTLPSSPKSYLSELRPLFPPPPFTPSHPVFVHFSSLAASRSLFIRSAAEQYIAEVIRCKVSEIEQAEKELKRQVEGLWKNFREGVSHIRQRQSIQAMLRSPSQSRERDSPIVTNGAGSPPYGTPLPVRDFLPMASPPPRATHMHVPRVSALSSSIAASSFHHPRAREDDASPPLHTLSLSTTTAVSSDSMSSISGSSTLVIPPPTEGSSVLRFRPNINDTINTEASYRYFMNLEEEMVRHERERQKEQEGKQQEADQSKQAGPSQATGSPRTNGNKSHKKRSTSQSSVEDSDHRDHIQEEESTQSRGREKGLTKGKRKVTFDVQPAVVTIKRESYAEQEDEDAVANRDPREMIFDLEVLDEEGSDRSTNYKPTLPLLEQPSVTRPARPRKPRPQNNSIGLSASYSGLRPTSLPTPSNVRPPRSPRKVDSSSMIHSLPRSSSPIHLEEPHRRIVSPQEEEFDPNDAEILKLVAADTPSHRGAWKPDSKAWKTFVRRKDSKTRTGSIPEECEDDSTDTLGLGLTELGVPQGLSNNDDLVENEAEDQYQSQPPIVGSLPVPMRLSSQPRQALSLASYQPEATLPDRLEPALQKPISSVAMRKAAYAERDRSRSMDPGALDFATEEDEEEAADDEPSSEMVESGGRGRKCALKILQARSELPEPGMWRSLAL